MCKYELQQVAGDTCNRSIEDMEQAARSIITKQFTTIAPADTEIVSVLSDYVRMGREYASAQQEAAKYDYVDMGILREIASERTKQQIVKGWTPEHDDCHTQGELAIAAACYALNGLPENKGGVPVISPVFPWPVEADKRSRHNRRQSLIIAAALAVAEILRIDRVRARELMEHRDHK